MTPDELRAARNQLGLTQAALAPLLNYKHARSISAMETGQRAIPWHVGRLMQCYLLLAQDALDEFR